jgi:hypothetical protein
MKAVLEHDISKDTRSLDGANDGSWFLRPDHGSHMLIKKPVYLQRLYKCLVEYFESLNLCWLLLDPKEA